MKKKVLITGAGSGIGKAIAEKLADTYDLILCGRRIENLKQVQNSLKGNHQVVRLDVNDRKNLAELKEFLTGQSLYAVIANHGIAGANFFGEADRFDQIMQTNVYGTYHLVEATIDSLRNENGYKHIVMTSSILGKIGVPGFSGYCTSKAALLGMSKSMAMEFINDKILVNTVCPGWVNTDMAREGIESFANAIKVDYEKALQMQMAQVPLGKMSEPEELADLFKFIISDANKSMTGQSFDINNGSYMS